MSPVYEFEARLLHPSLATIRAMTRYTLQAPDLTRGSVAEFVVRIPQARFAEIDELLANDLGPNVLAQPKRRLRADLNAKLRHMVLAAGGDLTRDTPILLLEKLGLIIEATGDPAAQTGFILLVRRDIPEELVKGFEALFTLLSPVLHYSSTLIYLSEEYRVCFYFRGEKDEVRFPGGMSWDPLEEFYDSWETDESEWGLSLVPVQR